MDGFAVGWGLFQRREKGLLYKLAQRDCRLQPLGQPDVSGHPAWHGIHMYCELMVELSWTPLQSTQPLAPGPDYLHYDLAHHAHNLLTCVTDNAAYLCEDGEA